MNGSFEETVCLFGKPDGPSDKTHGSTRKAEVPFCNPDDPSVKTSGPLCLPEGSFCKTHGPSCKTLGPFCKTQPRSGACAAAYRVLEPPSPRSDPAGCGGHRAVLRGGRHPSHTMWPTMKKAPTVRKSGNGSKRVARAPRAAGGNRVKAAATIRFSATLLRPAGKPVSWTFLTLPKRASARLPSRGMVSVEGTISGSAFRATLQPDGKGGHWLKVDRKMREAAGAQAGDAVTLEIAPLPPDREPEPKAPPDLRKALSAAPPEARAAWSGITPVARRDWIAWIVSAKQAGTRARRIASACDMLAKGKRRPCCFDRSGMYGRSMSCPVAEDG